MIYLRRWRYPVIGLRSERLVVFVAFFGETIRNYYLLVFLPVPTRNAISDCISAWFRVLPTTGESGASIIAAGNPTIFSVFRFKNLFLERGGGCICGDITLGTASINKSFCA